MGLRGHLAGALALALGLSAPAWAQASNGIGTPFELAFWQSVTGSDDPTLYEAYLQQYPTGTFSALAKAKVARLRNGAVPAVETALPPQPLARVDLVPVQVPSPPSPSVQPSILPSSVSQAAADSALLAELAQSQEVGGATLQLAAAQGFSLPARPVLNDVPDLPLPGAFCSADQRNAFHETRYKPVLELARANNAAAVAHMQRLQQVYDSLQLARDPTPMNVIAAEASEYQQQVAARTYNRQMAMVQQFDAIMAVPVGGCQIVATK